MYQSFSEPSYNSNTNTNRLLSSIKTLLYITYSLLEYIMVIKDVLCAFPYFRNGVPAGSEPCISAAAQRVGHT